MAKGLAPVFFTTCGVVVAGIVGYVIIEPGFYTEKGPVIIAEKKPLIENKVEERVNTKKQQTAKLETTLDVIKPEPVLKEKTKVKEPVEIKTPLPVKLVFDLVRVEKDGSTVIAGAGPKNQTVELIDGNKKLAETNINSAGEFVFVLDKPLEPGSHELFLRVVPKDGKAVLSSSFAFVDVPKPNKIDNVTVLLAEAGKPSQVLQKAETAPKTIEVTETKAPKPEAPQDVAEIAKKKATEKIRKKPNKVVSSTAQASVPIAKPENTPEKVPEVEEPEASTQPAPVVKARLAPVLIEAADIEAGKIFIAGTGEPRASVNIYLENKLLGSAIVADNGAFLFEAVKDIKAGRYDVRADMTKGNGTEVLARAEVRLIHEPKIANVIKQEETKPIVKEEPTVTPAQDAVVKSEPETEVKLNAMIKPENVASTSPEPETKPEPEPAITIETESRISDTGKKEILTGSAVIIRRGDNLWTVARRNYGAGIRYTTIFDANRDQVRNPHRIYPGQVLKIPEATQSVE